MSIQHLLEAMDDRERGKRGSGISVLIPRHDNDDDDYICIGKIVNWQETSGGRVRRMQRSYTSTCLRMRRRSACHNKSFVFEVVG